MTTAMAKAEDRLTFTPEQVELLKRTICKGATDDELALFLGQCRRTGLDPFTRQCHAVKRWDSREKREVMTIQTGIDGFRLIAERTGRYAGNDDPVYDSESGPHPTKATVTVWKLVKGQRVSFSRSARWAEFVQTTSKGDITRFWAKMPYLMLGKVAEALALRAAFPQELGGLYTSDETGQAEVIEADDVEVRPALPAKAPQQHAEPVAEAAAEAAGGDTLMESKEQIAELDDLWNKLNDAKRFAAVIKEKFGKGPDESLTGAEAEWMIDHVKKLLAKPANGHAAPANGAELAARLTTYDAKLAAEGRFETGELLAHVRNAGEKAGHGRTLANYAGPAIALAVEAAKEFGASHPAPAKAG